MMRFNATLLQTASGTMMSNKAVYYTGMTVQNDTTECVCVGENERKINSLEFRRCMRISCNQKAFLKA